MNDETAANTIIKWYESTTARKAKKKDAGKLIKCKYILDGARKNKGLGEDWRFLLSDKLLEIGYELKAALNGDRENGHFACVIYQKIVK